MTALDTPTARALGDPCPRCDVALPLASTPSPAGSVVWQCAACGEPSSGQPVEGFDARVAATVRLTPDAFFTPGKPSVSVAARGHATRLRSRVSARHGEGRSETAVRDLAAVALPMNQGFLPAGEAFNCLVYCMTSSGLRLISPTDPGAQWLAIELGPTGPEAIQLVSRVARRLNIGVGCYELGVEFTMRLGG